MNLLRKSHFYSLLLLLILSLFLTACSTTRPTALPYVHAQKLPWGAIDLDIKSNAEYSIKNSLGSAIKQKAGRYSKSEQNVPEKMKEIIVEPTKFEPEKLVKLSLLSR